MRSTLLLAVLTLPIASVAAQAPKAVVVTPDAVQWGPAPAILPAGAKLAVLDGDPTKPGLFTMRLSMISGKFQVGMGDTFDPAKLSTLPTGTFGMIPAGMRHFAQAKGSTVLQLHGTGPWKLTYVNPADQPKTTSHQ